MIKLSDVSAIESAEVFKGDQLAGILQRTKKSSTFTYDASFREACLSEGTYGLCFTLSPREEMHEAAGSNLHTFFAGLLPEGLRLKALVSNVKTSTDDLFSLLLASGTNTIGDVFAFLEKDSALEMPEVTKLESTSFFELFKESIASAEYQTRQIDSSIAGVMPKVSSQMISFPLKLHKKNKHYILKLSSGEYPALIENEHFFMKLAAKAGIKTAKTTLVKDKDGKSGLLVERFDRVHNKQQKRFNKLHVEDACQFLDRYPQDKYRLGYRDILEGIQQWSVAPKIDLQRALELYIFSYLIGNGDLHAKNISLLESLEGRRITLAPAYDLLSTLPYGDLRMALKINGRDHNFTQKQFLEFGAAFEIPERALRTSIERLKTAVAESIEEVRTIGLEATKANLIVETFKNRARKI